VLIWRHPFEQTLTHWEQRFLKGGGWYGHEGGGETQFRDFTKMRVARCRLACQDDLRYVII
jgi:hypothetical protein